MDGEAEVLDTGLDQGAELETPEIEADGAEPEGATPEAGERETPPGQEGEKPQLSDPKVLGKEADKFLKGLRNNQEVPKQVAQRVSDAYYREQAYSKHGTVQEVADAMTTLANIGGREGIEEMRAEMQEYASLVNRFDQGDGEAIGTWAKEAPEGFKKAAPEFLKQLYNLDQDAYGRTVAPIISNTLRAYMQGNGNDPKAAVEALAKDLEETLRNVPRETANPEQSKQKEEWDKIYGEKTNMHVGEVGAQTQSYQKSLIDRALSGYIKQRNLTSGQKQDLMETLLGDSDGINKGEIFRALRSDEAYQRQLKTSLSKIREDIAAGKDVSELKRRVIQFVNSKLDEIVPKTVRSVWNKRFAGTPAGKPAGRVSPAAGPSGPVQQPGEPIVKVEGWQELYIGGKVYVMRNGRQVLVNRAPRKE